MHSPSFRTELQRVRDAIGAARIAVLGGAGISAPPPASRPLAAALVERTIGRVLEPYQERLRAVSLRPEMLFSYLLDKSEPATIAAIDEAISGGRHKRLHDFCAQIIGVGGAVVTTNFDTLIEAALEARGTSFHRCVYRCRERDSVLFKIHGSIDDPQSLIVTMDHVGAGLRRDRTETLEALLRDRLALVIGYSGNDQLDIVPALRGCAYDRLVWIDHEGSDRCRRAEPRVPELRALPRTAFWRGPTALIVEALSPSPLQVGHRAARASSQRLGAALSDLEKKQVVVEILMHQDRYEEVRDFIDTVGHTNDRRLRIARFEAEGSISTRSPDWVDERDAFLDELFESSSDTQIEFLPTMAKFNHRLDRLRQLREIELRALGDADFSPRHVEASIETLYELIYNHFLDEAQELEARISAALERRPLLLLQGRLEIERAYLATQLFLHRRPVPDLIDAGVAAAERALYLLSPRICNDAFFCNQARSNLGRLRGLGGQVEAGARTLQSARRYFRGVSVNNYLTQIFYQAELRRREGEFESARRLLRSFFRINRDSGRTYWLGFAWREAAICAKALGATLGHQRRLLELARRHFEDEENHAEARLTAAIESRLLDVASKEFLRKPLGIAWKPC